MNRILILYFTILTFFDSNCLMAVERDQGRNWESLSYSGSELETTCPGASKNREEGGWYAECFLVNGPEESLKFAGEGTLTVTFYFDSKINTVYNMFPARQLLELYVTGTGIKQPVEPVRIFSKEFSCRGGGICNLDKNSLTPVTVKLEAINPEDIKAMFNIVTNSPLLVRLFRVEMVWRIKTANT